MQSMLAINRLCAISYYSSVFSNYPHEILLSVGVNNGKFEEGKIQETEARKIQLERDDACNGSTSKMDGMMKKIERS